MITKYSTVYIRDSVKVDTKRYSSGLKKDLSYKQTVDSVLDTLSENLNIPWTDLYNALFFQKSTESKGLIFVKGE